MDSQSHSKVINRSFGFSTDHKSPSDFRIRDYLLGEVLFNVLGVNIYMLGRTSCIEINNIEELQVRLGYVVRFLLVLMFVMFLRIVVGRGL